MIRKKIDSRVRTIVENGVNVRMHQKKRKMNRLNSTCVSFLTRGSCAIERCLLLLETVGVTRCVRQCSRIRWCFFDFRVALVHEAVVGSVVVSRSLFLCSDCQPALHADQGADQGPPLCPLVLQERAGLHDVRKRSVSRAHNSLRFSFVLTTHTHTHAHTHSHKHKRMREVKRKIQRGQAEAGKEDPFDLFISSTDIRYVWQMWCGVVCLYVYVRVCV